MIERQTRQQSFLIEDLLDLNRREIGKIELHGSLIDLRECVQHATETNQAEVALNSRRTVRIACWRAMRSSTANDSARWRTT